jgi:membrane fusion protein, multidrug efflux system
MSMSKSKKPMLALLLVIAAAAGGWYWYANLRDVLSSDDAFIDADSISLSSKMLGRVVTLAADEGDRVKRGQLLVQLDDAELKAQQVMAQATISAARKNTELARVNLERARADFSRYDQLNRQKMTTQELFDHSRSAFESATVQLDIALAQVETAKAQLQVVDSQLRNTRIEAPIDGLVTKRWISTGEIVQPGQAILSLHDAGNMWVTAFIEETKLNQIRIGAEVNICVDSQPGRIFSGVVRQTGSATASKFSLIPPNNASGNFTKITQRVPIRIGILRGDGREALLPGMSVIVSIKVRQP